MVGLLGKWVSRYDSSGSDPQGRWSWILLNGQSNTKVILISAYRVSQQSPKGLGYNTAFMQQYRYQLAQGLKNPLPKKAILHDLTTFIHQIQNKHKSLSIILLMDANEVLTETGQLRDFISTTGLDDAIQILNPVHAKHRPTYMKSKNRLDYIFTTPDVIQCAHDAGHYDHKELIQTADHCGIYLKLDATKLFNMQSMDITHLSLRRLRLHNRTAVEEYLHILKELFHKHKIITRLNHIVKSFRTCTTIKKKKQLIEELNVLDKEKTRYMLAAEKKAGQKIPQGIYEWSPLLEIAGRTYTYWKSRLSLVLNKLQIPSYMEELQEDLNIISTSNTKSYVKAKLFTARLNLRATQKKSSIVPSATFREIG